MRSLRLGTVDFGAYLKAFALLARNPQIALAPLLAAIAQVLLFMLMPAEPGAGFLGSANSSIAGLIAQLIWSLGLGVALIVAETAWRRGKAPLDDALDEGKRKAGGIMLAAFGFNFVIYVASLIGGFLGSLGGYAMTLLADFFFIYTIPAASIGGLPGAAALNASVERAQRTVASTALVTAVYVFAFGYAPTLIVDALSPLLLSNSPFASGVVSSLIVAAIKAVVAGYVALVLAKAYDDASYGRFY